MILSEFDSIQVINLRERRDRRRKMIKELGKVGLLNDPRVSFFDAIRPPDSGGHYSTGAHGVFLSHLAILQQAASRNASVLILEDDCVFDPNVTNYILPPSWDIFYGGYEAMQLDRDLHDSDIEGAHMMGFNAHTARQISEYLVTLQASNNCPPIDGAYVWYRRAHPTSKTVFAIPKLGYQRASRSDIAPRLVFDRIPIVRDFVELLRGLHSLMRG